MAAMTAEKSEKMAKVFSGFGMSRMRRKATLSDLKVVLAKKDTIDPEFDTEDESAVDDQACQVIIRCRPSQVGRYGKVCTLTSDAAGRDRFTVTIEPPEGETGTKRSRPFRCHRYLPPDTEQDEIFEEGEWVIERTMEGYNSTVLCHGITGSGKSHTMWGHMDDTQTVEQMEESLGFAHRVSHAIFEYIRDHSLKGEVFAVEAQFLQIASEDGMKEKLLDLLAQEERPLQIKPDAFNAGNFVCEGLTTVPIRSPDEMVDVLHRGLERSQELEKSKFIQASRSHVALMISVENMKDSSSPGGEAEIQRGRLVLVDLAGSESLKYIQLRRGAEKNQTSERQAIGINRVLASLASAVNSANDKVPPGNHRDSSLTLMLKDCVGANARVMLIANVSPEFDFMEETQKTLTFAQQMIAAKDHVIPTGHRINREQSSLVKMRNRHQECIRILHEKAIDTSEQQRHERGRLQAEFEDLNRRLLTAESAADALDAMKSEQLRKIDEIRHEVTNTMSQELQSLRLQSVQDLETLRKSLSEEKAEEINKVLKEHDDKMKSIAEELEALKAAKRKADDEVAQHKMKLAASEQELKWVQSREEDLRRESSEGQEERRELRLQVDQLWQKVSMTETDLHRAKAEAEMQRAEAARLSDERCDLQEREASIQRQAVEQKRQLEECRQEAEAQEARHEVEQREMHTLRLQVQQLEKLRSQAEKLEEDRDEGRQREEEMKEQFAQELHGFQVELEQARQREVDLLNLLNEVQDSIIVAADTA
mmetsp:Transcript_38108/g.89284  ORF Transcript_38108/g.89284 Transcript_38108/m.89284 type:complete len:765 (+) Transcript_38108:94-2388(+)